MNNPEKIDLKLNFSNLFNKSRLYDLQMKQGEQSNRSQSKSARQNITHRTARFIPKCPFERSVSVRGSRKSQHKGVDSQDFGIFSIKALENRSFGFMSQSIETKNNGQRNQFIISVKNSNLHSFKADRFEIFKNQLNNEQKKTKIRGLRIRTGSQAKKNKSRIEFDCNNVIIKGQKIVK